MKTKATAKGEREQIFSMYGGCGEKGQECIDILLGHLEKAITALKPKTMSEWRDISTAPKDGTYCFCWSLEWGDLPVICQSHTDGYHYLKGATGVRVPATHWMPLPEAPPSPMGIGRY